VLGRSRTLWDGQEAPPRPSLVLLTLVCGFPVPIAWPVCGDLTSVLKGQICDSDAVLIDLNRVRLANGAYCFQFGRIRGTPRKLVVC
jgi:hypothetical protein